MKELECLKKEHKMLSSKVDSHLQKFQPLSEKLSGLIRQVAEVERLRSYASWIQKIESVRLVVATAINFVIFVDF